MEISFYKKGARSHGPMRPSPLPVPGPDGGGQKCCKPVSTGAQEILVRP